MTKLHCWQDKAEWAEQTYGEYSPEHIAAMDADATCMLSAGHDGPHDFVSDDDITVEFPQE